MSSYLAGVFVGTLMQLAVLTIVAVGSSDPDAAALAVLFPICFALLWPLNCARAVTNSLVAQSITQKRVESIFICVSYRRTDHHFILLDR
jgi:Na+-driven multidrug efflux pump